jgi:AraC family transcriptional activator FtrA
MPLFASILPMSLHRVVTVPVGDVSVLDLAGPTHFFGIVGDGHYELLLAAAEPGRVATSTGFDLIVENGPDVIETADTVIIPGYGMPDDPPGPPEQSVLDAMRVAADRGARMISICTGTFVLGYAGLLHGRRATTHWAAAAELAARFPEVEVDPDVLFVDEDDVLTSAGAAAGLDLCLHVIRKDLGAEVASEAARITVVAPHRDGGQAQFINLPVPERVAADADLAATRAWALERLDKPLDVATMAAHAMVSPRTFARRFRDETGTTPHRWLLHQRILHARRLLEASDVPIEEVASSAGFGSAASLREHFRRSTGTTPTAYRRTFAGVS